MKSITRETLSDNYNSDKSLTLYINETRSHKLLTLEDEQRLARAAHNGCLESRNELIECNLKLVISIAKKYLGNGVDFVDLIEEGNLGLIKATEGYDPEKGFRFSTYAAYWIRKYIELCTRNANASVSIPYDVKSKLWQIKKIKMKNRHISDREIAKKINVDLPRLRQIMRSPTKRVTDDHDPKIEHEERSPGNVDVKTMAHLVGVDNEIEASVHREETRKIIRQLLDNLPKRNADILRLRYGIDEQPIMDLRAIGELYGISHERVRQIEKNVLEKARFYLDEESLGAF